MKHCTKPPDGWRCSREHDHEGPCAATETPGSDRNCPVGNSMLRDTCQLRRNHTGLHKFTDEDCVVTWRTAREQIAFDEGRAQENLESGEPDEDAVLYRGALVKLVDAVEADRREPDKLLCHLQAARTALL